MQRAISRLSKQLTRVNKLFLFFFSPLFALRHGPHRLGSRKLVRRKGREKGEGRENDSKTEADRPVLRGRDSETNRQMKQRNRERETKPKTGRDNDINEHRKVVMLTPPS